MTVLCQDQIDRMVRIMDYILTHPAATVFDIKQKFGLDEDEYEMIFDLTMPLIREINVKKYWNVKYHGLINKLAELGRDSELCDSDFKKNVLKIISDRSNAEPYMEEALGDEEDDEVLSDEEIEEILSQEIPLLRAHSLSFNNLENHNA